MEVSANSSAKSVGLASDLSGSQLMVKQPASGMQLNSSGQSVATGSDATSYLSNVSAVSANVAASSGHPRPSSRVIPADEIGTHQVTFTVTISVAFPSGPEDKEETVPTSRSAQAKLSKKVVEVPRTQHFLHCEYVAFPGDSQPIQTDIVLYGRLAAKIFTDQLDAKIVQAWSCEDVTWVSWSNCHTVTVTESLLKDMVNHTLVVHVWDNKEKCSARARFDKPKAFKLPHDKPEDGMYGGVGVRPAVLQQCDNYLSHQPKRFRVANVDELKENQMPNNEDLGEKLVDILRQRAIQPVVPASILVTSSATNKSPKPDTPSAKKNADKVKSGNKDVTEPPTCSISVSLAKLFAGTLTVTERLNKPEPSVADAFTTVALSEPLLSHSQRQSLNPLVVQIHSATKMPSTPISLHELKLRCQPAYVKYSILGLPEHRSEGLPHDKNLYWDDIHVILAGLLDQYRVREYLYGPSFEVEIHDRDRIIHKYEEGSSLFGEERHDDIIGLPDTENTAEMSDAGAWKCFDTYGVARFDLSELLLGHTVLQLRAPVMNCRVTEAKWKPCIGVDGRLVPPPGVKEGPIEPVLAAGDYMASDASLKMRVNLAYPLTSVTELAEHTLSQPSPQCPFARIVYIFPRSNSEFLDSLLKRVADVNAQALHLNSLRTNEIETALMTYKLTNDQAEDRALNVLTGFRLVDADSHLVVLEGLREAAGKDLAENVCSDMSSDVKILQHSDISFHQRLYSSFDVDVFCVELFDSLSSLLRNPLVYVRGMVPCFDILIKLQELSRAKNLRSAIRSDLFPSAEMILYLSREFGVPMTAQHFTGNEDEDESETGVSENTGSSEETIDVSDVNNNEAKTSDDHQNMNSKDSFSAESLPSPKSTPMQRNKMNVALMSERVRAERSKNPPVFMEGKSTDQALRKIRCMLAKHDPHHLYTFCPEFHHSMTLAKNTVREAHKKEARRSREQWMTSFGWRNRGRMDSLEMNRHPRHLDPSKIGELMIPFGELYDNSIEQFYSRDPFPWDRRKEDLDIWTKAPEFQKVPVSLDSGSEKSASSANKLQKAKTPRIEGARAHRCNIETELIERGCYATNQLDRLRGILKDPPGRLTLRHLPANVPALSVVHDPSVDTEARAGGAQLLPSPTMHEYRKGLTPGTGRCLSLTAKGNYFPMADYERQKFAELRGHDFNIYNRSRNKLYSRRIAPSSKEEASEYRALWCCGQPPKLAQPPCSLPQAHPEPGFPARVTCGTSGPLTSEPRTELNPDCCIGKQPLLSASEQHVCPPSVAAL